MALLWPEEDPGSDRITNRLVFVPPSYSADDSIGQKLKNILFYYGLGSWFPLKPGRDMFREARCPVDTCNITLDQNQTADADAIVYHHRFAQPGHPRPPRQVRRLYLLHTHRVPLKLEMDCSVLICVSEFGYLKFVTRLSFYLISHHSVRKYCDWNYRIFDCIIPFSYYFIIQAITNMKN
jgi:hypothetical protein